MEDYKWIIYVIAALYFIFRSRKKKSPSPEGESRPFNSNTTTTSTSSPVTFEDLLREIQQTKVNKPEAKPITQSKPLVTSDYVDYDDDLKEERRDLEDVNYNYRNQDKIYETYEKAKSEAFNRPSLEETLNVNDTIVRFGQFKEYGLQKADTIADSFASDLRNKDNFKKAFILSEILNRKF